jgi:hypothetical protein
LSEKKSQNDWFIGAFCFLFVLIFGFFGGLALGSLLTNQTIFEIFTSPPSINNFVYILSSIGCFFGALILSLVIAPMAVHLLFKIKFLMMKKKNDSIGLMRYLNHEDFEVRRNAASSLEKMGWQPDTPENKAIYLIALQDWAKLIEFGEPSIEPLIKALDRGENRFAIVQTLGKIQDAKTAKALIRAWCGLDRDYDEYSAIAEGPGYDEKHYYAVFKANSNLLKLRREIEKTLKTMGNVAMKELTAEGITPTCINDREDFAEMLKRITFSKDFRYSVLSKKMNDYNE